MAKHIGRARSHDYGTTEKGNDFIAIEFSIEEGPKQGDRLTWRGFFTEKTQERTVQSMRYCGWAGSDFNNLDGLTDNLVELVVEPEEYEGKTYDRIQWVNRLGVSLKNAMGEGERAAFAQRMKGLALSVDAGLAEGVKASDGVPAENGKTSDYNQASEAGGFEGDDVPFMRAEWY